MEPFMPKGVKIYWKDQLVCESVMDCYSGDPMTIDNFTWYTDKPQLGDPIHPAIVLWVTKRNIQRNSPKVRNVGRDE
jgi:hypothetical protein